MSNLVLGGKNDRDRLIAVAAEYGFDLMPYAEVVEDDDHLRTILKALLCDVKVTDEDVRNPFYTAYDFKQKFLYRPIKNFPTMCSQIAEFDKLVTKTKVTYIDYIIDHGLPKSFVTEFVKINSKPQQLDVMIKAYKAGFDMTRYLNPKLTAKKLNEFLHEDKAAAFNAHVNARMSR